MRSRRRFAVAPVVALSLALTSWSSPASAEPAPADAKVHTLIVVDSLDERIGESVALDGELVEDALRSGFKGREKQLALTILRGKDATPDAVLKHYRDLKVGPSDTVLFYFSGHGGVVRDRGHYLALQGRRLSREDLLDAIKGTKPRLTVCITDCCAVFSDVAPEVPRGVKFPWATLESLLLRHRGVVDINACSVGELAWCDKKGSLFTLALVEGLGKTPAELGGESGEFVHWDDFFRVVKKGTEARFKKMKATDPQGYPESQTPQAFLLPPHRFGAVGKDGPDGVVVARVYSGSPAEAAAIKTGDVILKVGDAAVRTREQLDEAIGKGSESVLLTVRPAGSKDTVTRKVRLGD